MGFFLFETVRKRERGRENKGERKKKESGKEIRGEKENKLVTKWYYNDVGEGERGRNGDKRTNSIKV